MIYIYDKNEKREKKNRRQAKIDDRKTRQNRTIDLTSQMNQIVENKKDASR